MMVAAHPGGYLAVTQPAHAWLSGQLARAWGAPRFGPVVPWEEVCLAAEQHDVGMAAWERAPTLDPVTGLPTTFTAMDIPTHLRLWSEGPELLAGQSRYAALLCSRHGSGLYEQRDLSGHGAVEREQVAAFLAERRAFEDRLRAALGASEPEVLRNERLVRTWDGLSLALILGWAPWSALGVPDAADRTSTVSLSVCGSHLTLSPWPMREDRVLVHTEGRLLERTYTDEAELHGALRVAPSVELSYELRAA